MEEQGRFRDIYGNYHQVSGTLLSFLCPQRTLIIHVLKIRMHRERVLEDLLELQGLWTLQVAFNANMCNIHARVSTTVLL